MIDYTRLFTNVQHRWVLQDVADSDKPPVTRQEAHRRQSTYDAYRKRARVADDRVRESLSNDPGVTFGDNPSVLIVSEGHWSQRLRNFSLATNVLEEGTLLLRSRINLGHVTVGFWATRVE